MTRKITERYGFSTSETIFSKFKLAFLMNGPIAIKIKIQTNPGLIFNSVISFFFTALNSVIFANDCSTSVAY